MDFMNKCINVISRIYKVFLFFVAHSTKKSVLVSNLSVNTKSLGFKGLISRSDIPVGVKNSQVYVLICI